MAFASDDFAIEIECLKLLAVMVIAVFQQSNELDPENSMRSLPSPTTFWIALQSLLVKPFVVQIRCFYIVEMYVVTTMHSNFSLR